MDTIYDRIRFFLYCQDIEVKCRIEDFKKYIIKNKIKIYIDMDGVLTYWNNDTLAVYLKDESKNQFFLKLKPMVYNVQALLLLVELLPNNVFILSKSPDIIGKKDKIEWLKQYVPNLKDENIIIIYKGDKKEDFVKNIYKSLLVDDFGKNISSFKNKGGMVIKVYNDRNSTPSEIKKEKLKYGLTDVFTCENIISVIKYFEKDVLSYGRKNK